MAMLYHTGFELGPAQVDEWIRSGNLEIRSNIARSGVYSCWMNNGTLYLPLYKSCTTIYARFGWDYTKTGGANGAWFGVTEGTRVHCYIRNNGSGFNVYNGNNTLLGATSGWAYQLNRWYLVEFMVTIGDATGAVAMKVDGQQVLDLTNVDTCNGGTGTCDRFAMYLNWDHEWYIDDLAICDDTGPDHNSWLGNGQSVLLAPNGPGDITEWIPSTGTNWQNVDEVPTDNDTSYVDAATVNARDLYTCSDIAPTPASAVNAVRLLAVAKAADAGDSAISLGVKSGGTEDWGPDRPLAYNVYNIYSRYLPSNLAGQPWSIDELNAVQVGVKAR